jgi:hypothetical protein
MSPNKGRNGLPLSSLFKLDRTLQGNSRVRVKTQSGHMIGERGLARPFRTRGKPTDCGDKGLSQPKINPAMVISAAFMRQRNVHGTYRPSGLAIMNHREFRSRQGMKNLAATKR